MCRLLGIVSSEPTEFRIILQEGPRSLAGLSRDHRDGWGLAVFEPDGDPSACGEWRLHKAVACAAEDDGFRRLGTARGALMISHVRRRTVGAISLENTHPFRAGRWVFAHNGTIRDREYLQKTISERRLADVKGHTDSELFFAYLLSELDEGNMADVPATPATDVVVAEAIRRACANPDFGSVNFLLSDGLTMYAHRFGRTLFVLERTPGDEVRRSRRSKSGTTVMTPWSGHRTAILVASEAMTAEPWRPVAERELLRIDRRPEPRCRLVAA